MFARRRNVTWLALLVLPSVVLATALPRDARYMHQHAGGEHAHVHGWDGSRLGHSTASMRDFLDAVEHGHVHPHPPEDGTRAAARREGPASATPPRSPSAHGLQLAAAQGPAHAHWQAPFQAIARAATAGVVFTPLHVERTASPATRLASAALPALRARAPPSAVSA